MCTQPLQRFCSWRYRVYRGWGVPGAGVARYHLSLSLLPSVQHTGTPRQGKEEATNPPGKTLKDGSDRAPQ